MSLLILPNMDHHVSNILINPIQGRPLCPKVLLEKNSEKKCKLHGNKQINHFAKICNALACNLFMLLCLHSDKKFDAHLQLVFFVLITMSVQI